MIIASIEHDGMKKAARVPLGRLFHVNLCRNDNMAIIYQSSRISGAKPEKHRFLPETLGRVKMQVFYT